MHVPYVPSSPERPKLTANVPKRAKVAAVKSPAERGPIGAWAYESRTEADLSVPAVIEQLARRGVRVTEATLRGIEGGSKKPGRRLLRELASIYGSVPPGEPQAATEQFLDLGPLLDRLDRMVESNEKLAAAIERQAGAIETTSADVGTIILLRERIGLLENALKQIETLVPVARTQRTPPGSGEAPSGSPSHRTRTSVGR